MKSYYFHKNFKIEGQSFSSIQEMLAFAKLVSVDAFLFLEEWFNSTEFIEVETSGSTGKPKLTKLKKEFMINSAKATGNCFKLGDGTTALLCMSPNYIAGKMMLVRALVLGWNIDIVAPVSNPLEGKNKCYDFSAMVPLQLSNSLEQLNKVKTLIVGGGAVSAELQQKIQDVNCDIFVTYGMTETITHIAIRKLNNFNNDTIEGVSYKVLPGIEISTDNRGCLVINAPKLSVETVVTNDLVKLVSTKEFIWLGRFDSVVNSGGIKLIPELIEEKISSQISQRFFVAGLPDSNLGEKLIIVVEAQDLNSKELLGKLKSLSLLKKYEVPKEVLFISKFIETPTGKINRKKSLALLQ